MPSIFFSGDVSFKVTGSAAQKKDLQSAVANNEHGIIISYEEDGMPTSFYIHPFHLTSGSIDVVPSGKDFLVTFSGVAKVPLAKATADFVANKENRLKIEGMFGDSFRIYINGNESNAIESPLKVSKSAPKK